MLLTGSFVLVEIGMLTYGSVTASIVCVIFRCCLVFLNLKGWKKGSQVGGVGEWAQTFELAFYYLSSDCVVYVKHSW